MIDITRFSYEAIGLWIVAFLVMEFPMRYIYLNYVGGTYLTRWYGFKEFDAFNVIIGDLFYMLVGLIIAYRVHAYFCADLEGFVPRFASLFAIFWVIQMVGDVLFYTIIKNIPNGSKNKWIKFFIDYGNDAKLNAVFGDSIYILVWALTVCAVRFLPNDMLLALVCFYVFILSIYSEQK
jgi:hypothetical protein